MDDPPSYEESSSVVLHDEKSDTKTRDRFFWSLQDEVTASRSDHVRAAAKKVKEVLEARARGGVSKTDLILLPSEQAALGKISLMELLAVLIPNTVPFETAELVEFQGTQKPVLIALQGLADSTEFWSQPDAVKELEVQISIALGIEEPAPSVPAIPPREPPTRKSFTFSRQTTSSATRANSQRSTSDVPPRRVQTVVEEVYFRTETPFGLYETIAVQAVVVRIKL